ncbi:MAG TPA: hypothetical protein VEB42_14110 [Chitinophagaceae bacterium]|nr:hypothetical protein [Chitinophagaceae bacterium]
MRILIALLLIIPGSAVHAQDYQLKDFKYRTTGYRLMRLDGKLNSDAGFRKKDSLNDAFSGGFETNDRLYFEKGYNLDKRQHASVFDGRLDARFSKGNGVNNNANLGFNYEQEDWFYKENYFFKTYFGGGINGGFTKQGKDPSLQKDNSKGGQLTASGAIGRGRLEYLSDAQTAMFIIEALYDAGKLKTRPAKDVVERLANLIVSVKNSRVLDSRRRMIYQLTQIGNFFSNEKLVTQCDPETVAIINDNLYYGFHNELTPNTDNTWRYYRVDPRNGDNSLNADFLPADYWDDPDRFNTLSYNVFFNDFMNDQFFRMSGTVYYVGVEATGGYSSAATRLGSGPKMEISQNNLSPAVFAVYEKHIPVNLHWQRVIQAFARYTNTRSTSKSNGNTVSETRYYTANLSGGYKVGYYPNNRTVIEGMAGGFLSYSNQAPDNKLSINLDGSISGGYFLSYSTVLRGSFRTAIPVKTAVRQWGYGLSFSILHYFF